MAKLRYRLGRWLLRPHVTALLEHYNEAQKQENKDQAERCAYISIGLKYAIGVGTEWKRLTAPD